MGSSNTGVKDDSTTDADTSTGDLPESSSGIFADGEKVLAYHGPRIYEAKVSFFFFFVYFLVLFDFLFLSLFGFLSICCRFFVV